MRINLDNPEISKNILPRNGLVEYASSFFSQMESQNYFHIFFHTIDWKNDETKIFGKTIITKRKVSFYGNDFINYTYSKTTKQALPWTDDLLKIKSKIETISGEKFNCSLLNLYHNGSEGMGWHTDAEKEMKKHGAIASVSFGAERKFDFKHKLTNEKVSIILQNGSLLLMKDETQDFWLHRLPVSKRITEPRINLTFRTIEN